MTEPEDDKDDETPQRAGYSRNARQKFDASADAVGLKITPPTEEGKDDDEDEGKSFDPWQY